MDHLDRIERNVKGALGSIDTREWARETVETVDGMENKLADIEKTLRKIQDTTTTTLKDVLPASVTEEDAATAVGSGGEEIAELARTMLQEIDKWEPGPEIHSRRQQTISSLNRQTEKYEQQLVQQHHEFRKQHTDRLARIFKDQLS